MAITRSGAAARIATLEQRVGEQRLVAERLARQLDEDLAVFLQEIGQVVGEVVAVPQVALLHQQFETVRHLDLLSIGGIAIELR